MKKLWTWFKRFWYGVWQIIKTMGTIRGVLSLLISWLALSGAGVSLIGATENSIIYATEWGYEKFMEIIGPQERNFNYAF